MLQKLRGCDIITKDYFGDDFMKRCICIFLSVIIFTSVLCSCGKNTDNDETKYVITTTENTNVTDYSEGETQIVIPEITIPSSDNEVQSTNAVVTTTDVPETVLTIPDLSVTETLAEEVTNESPESGKLRFSDSPDNKYIKAVVQKYGVDAENLAVIYEEPTGDSNNVLEFDGSKDENGKRIRTKETLIGIYTIDRNMNILLASLDEEKTEHSKTATIMAFALVIKYMLPEYQDELNK